MNSEGLTSSGVLPQTIANQANELYRRMFLIVDTFMPNSFVSQSSSVNTWPALANLITIMDGYEEAWKAYTNENWFLPVASIQMYTPQNVQESTSSWLTRALRLNATADLAQRAQTYLRSYMSLVKISTSLSGGCSDKSPVPEPGLRAISSNFNVSVYGKLRNRLPVSDYFNKQIECFLDMLLRLRPTTKIVGSQTTYISRSTKQYMPVEWYSVDIARQSGALGADFTFNSASSRTFQNDIISAQPWSETFTIKGRNNLVIAPGMRYHLMISFYWAKAAATADLVTITVRFLSNGVQATEVIDIPAAYVGVDSEQMDPILIDVTYDALDNPVVVYEIEYTSPATLGPNQVTIDHRESLAVSTPHNAPLNNNGIISVTGNVAPFTYREIVNDSTWGDYYGTQVLGDEDLIDQTNSLIGYCDEKFCDESATKHITDLLGLIIRNNLFVVQLIDDADTRFPAIYRGPNGSLIIIDSIMFMGMGWLLLDDGMMNFNAAPIPRQAQLAFFDRLTSIVRMVQSLYNFGNEEVSELVNRALLLK
jgi:hypothetical protein